MCCSCNNKAAACFIDLLEEVVFFQSQTSNCKSFASFLFQNTFLRQLSFTRFFVLLLVNFKAGLLEILSSLQFTLSRLKSSSFS